MLNFGSIFLLSLPFFSFLAQKMLTKHISTNIWSAQYPNAGQNIQQVTFYLKLNSDFIEGFRDDCNENILDHPSQKKDHCDEVEGCFPVLKQEIILFQVLQQNRTSHGS